MSDALQKRIREWFTLPIEGHGLYARYCDAEEILTEVLAVLDKGEPEPPECPSGCGCRWLNEPDRRDCACEGPCCYEGWETLPDGRPRPEHPEYLPEPEGVQP